MSISIFKPELWSPVLQRHLDRTLVYAQPKCANRNWEGDIADEGTTVKIQKIGDPTIHTYVTGEDMAAPERPDGTTQSLVVDQQKSFNVAIDDVDAAQVNIEALQEFATRAGVKMAQTIDAFVSAKIVTEATTNIIGTDEVPTVVKSDGTGNFTPYQFAVEIKRKLAAQNAPLDSLWIAVTPDFEAAVYKDPTFIAAGSEVGAEFVRNGGIGSLAGVEILRTTGAPTSAGSGGSAVPNVKIIAGAGNYATTFANQLTKMEAYRIQNQFGDAVKGLEVYGAKVLEPASLVVGHVKSSGLG